MRTNSVPGTNLSGAVLVALYLEPTSFRIFFKSLEKNDGSKANQKATPSVVSFDLHKYSVCFDERVGTFQKIAFDDDQVTQSASFLGVAPCGRIPQPY